MIEGSVFSEYIKPGRIFGNLYFVGIRAVCTHLIDTGDGLIIIDPGYRESLHIIIHNIRALGFNPMDIRYIIATHAHYDHADPETLPKLAKRFYRVNFRLRTSMKKVVRTLKYSTVFYYCLLEILT